MKTAKEILLKHLPFTSELWLNVNKEIFTAMEEYAEQFGGQFEQQVIPKIAEDKAKKMKECKHLNKVYEQGWLVDDFYCKDCGKIF